MVWGGSHDGARESPERAGLAQLLLRLRDGTCVAARKREALYVEVRTQALSTPPHREASA